MVQLISQSAFMLFQIHFINTESATMTRIPPSLPLKWNEKSQFDSLVVIEMEWKFC